MYCHTTRCSYSYIHVEVRLLASQAMDEGYRTVRHRKSVLYRYVQYRVCIVPPTTSTSRVNTQNLEMTGKFIQHMNIGNCT